MAIYSGSLKQAMLSVALSLPLNVYAASDEDLRDIREQIKQLKEIYEQRITQLEQRLQLAEASRQADSCGVHVHTVDTGTITQHLHLQSRK